ALGAALGVAAVAAADGRAGLAVRAAALVALVALAAVGDTVSYSQALWGVPGVRSVDAYGRRDSYG
ncbi:hypothetical protein, partial [Actinacidiphila soli]|uniref:hypothetical protein n=1 Tax=Actinacidiphila soli TaxID=2487275 RepID=UPI0019CFA563